MVKKYINAFLLATSTLLTFGGPTQDQLEGMGRVNREWLLKQQQRREDRARAEQEYMKHKETVYAFYKFV